MLSNMDWKGNRLQVRYQPCRGFHLNPAHQMTITQYESPRNLSTTPKKLMSLRKMRIEMKRMTEMTLPSALMQLAGPVDMIPIGPGIPTR